MSSGLPEGYHCGCVYNYIQACSLLLGSRLTNVRFGYLGKCIMTSEAASHIVRLLQTVGMLHPICEVYLHVNQSTTLPVGCMFLIQGLMLSDGFNALLDELVQRC